MDLILPVINRKKCTLCGICIDECKTHALRTVVAPMSYWSVSALTSLAIQDEQVIFAQPDLCNYCADCEGVCAQGAIRVEFEFHW